MNNRSKIKDQRSKIFRTGGFTPYHNAPLVRARVHNRARSEISQCPDRKVVGTGFTLIEIVVAGFFMSTLFALATVNLIGSSQKASINSQVATLLSEIKSQQLKAMIGDTEGRTTSDYYGVYFQSNAYILFHGSTFVPGESSNFTISLPTSLEFQNITFPQASLVFQKGSGEVLGFVSGANSVVVKDTVNYEQKTISVNRRGAVAVD